MIGADGAQRGQGGRTVMAEDGSSRHAMLRHGESLRIHWSRMGCQAPHGVLKIEKYWVNVRLSPGWWSHSI